MLAGFEVLYHGIAARTGSVFWCLYFYCIAFLIFYFKDSVPRGRHQEFVGEFAGFIAAEVCGVGVGPRTEAAITEIAISASIVRASHSISRIFVGKRLLAFRATFEVLSRIIFCQSSFKVPSFLRSKNSNLLADGILPFEAALSSSFYFKGTPDFSLSLRDNCPNMRSDASLADTMPARPLISIIFAVDWVLDIVDLQLSDLTERYFILFEDKFVSYDHIKIAKFSIISKFSTLVR